jgi:photosystem II stability/assembly factor-like uncharacterized protein
MLSLSFIRRGWLFAGAFLACSFASGAASANGRYPSAQLLVLDPSDPNRLWLRATYGLLTSDDRGCTWHRICETAPNYLGTEDPMFGVLANGTVIGGTFRGTTTTRDHGCNWSAAGPMEDQFVADLAVQPTDSRRAVAMVSSGLGDGGFSNQIYRTTDSAASWAKLGSALDSSLLLLTLDAAPSAPNKIYVTAIRFTEKDGGSLATEGFLLRTDDDGATWSERAITESVGGFEPWLSAVHPTDPNKIYVRLRGPDTGPDLVENRVVYSSDGGDTWQQIFRARADILGFALSPDGSRVLLGLGDSRSLGMTRPVDPGVLGIYAAGAQNHQFVRTRSGHIGCLTWSPDGVYFCATEYPIDMSPGFELGLTTDEGVTARQVMHRASIEGMLECPASSATAQVCLADEWLPICKDLGRCDFETGEYVAYPVGETCAGSGGSGAVSGTGGACGTVGSGGADAGVLGSNQGTESLNISGGCGTASGPASGIAALGLLSLSALGAWWRKRRARDRS